MKVFVETLLHLDIRISLKNNSLIKQMSEDRIFLAGFYD
jgi:hypothetical protein